MLCRRERCAEEQDAGVPCSPWGAGDCRRGPGQYGGAVRAGSSVRGWDEPRALPRVPRALPVLSCGASPTAPVPGCRAASEQLRLLNMQQVLYSEKFRRNFFVLACKCG